MVRQRISLKRKARRQRGDLQVSSGNTAMSPGEGNHLADGELFHGTNGGK